MKRSEIEIQINESYKLGFDPQNWMVIRMGTVKDKDSKNHGKITENTVSYDHGLEGVLKSVMKDMVKRGAIPEYIKHIDQLMEWYYTEQREILNTILSMKEELKEVLSINKVM